MRKIKKALALSLALAMGLSLVASDDFGSDVELSVLSPQATSDNPIASANERANAFLIFLTKKPSF